MFDNAEFPVIFFLVSACAFGVVLLYTLARAWEKALSSRPRRSAIDKARIETCSDVCNKISSAKCAPTATRTNTHVKKDA